MIFRVRHAFDFITETNESYPVNGMMNVAMHNEGTDTVKVNHVEVLPGEKIVLSGPNAVMEGAVNIRFEDTNGIKNLTVHYNKVIGAYTAITGEILTGEEQIMVAQNGCR